MAVNEETLRAVMEETGLTGKKQEHLPAWLRTSGTTSGKEEIGAEAPASKQKELKTSGQTGQN